MKADEKNNKLSKIAGQKSNFVDNPPLLMVLPYFDINILHCFLQS